MKNLNKIKKQRKNYTENQGLLPHKSKLTMNNYYPMYNNKKMIMMIIYLKMLMMKKNKSPLIKYIIEETISIKILLQNMKKVINNNQTKISSQPMKISVQKFKI